MTRPLSNSRPFDLEIDAAPASPCAIVSEPMIREQLNKILSSSLFSQSERLGRFLRFVIDKSLAADTQSVKEYVIGIEVYDRRPPYHPNQDSIVRTEARRLRGKLTSYYDSDGRYDPVLIAFRPGSYLPAFSVRAPACEREPSPPPLDAARDTLRLTVLPFTSTCERLSSHAHGITEDLSHALSQTSGIQVTARSSVASLLTPLSDIPALARALQIDALFEGDIREENDKCAVAVRMIGKDGFQLWSKRFQTSSAHEKMAAFQKDLASSLANRVCPHPSGADNSEVALTSLPREHYPLLLAAEDLSDQNGPENLDLALAKFQQLTRIAPTSARAAFGLGQCLLKMSLAGGRTSKNLLSQARTAALRAHQLDITMVAADSLLALLNKLEGSPNAGDQFPATLALRGGVDSFTHYALFLTATQRYREASNFLGRADKIDPFSPYVRDIHAQCCFLARQFEYGAQHTYERYTHGAPSSTEQLYLALNHQFLGQNEKALKLARGLRHKALLQPSISGGVAEILARCGERGEATRLIADYDLLSALCSPISKYRRALLALAIGDRAESISLLSEAVNGGEPEAIWLPVDPRFDCLRESADFALLQSTGSSCERERQARLAAHSTRFAAA